MIQSEHATAKKNYSSVILDVRGGERDYSSSCCLFFILPAVQKIKYAIRAD